MTTYGKTFHNWQIDRDDFPYGIPQLMMGFTADNQINQERLQDRDRRFGVSSSRRRRQRAAIPTPAVAAGANSWETGRSLQTRLEEVGIRR